MAFSSWKGCFVKVYEVVFSTSADHSHFCNSGSTFLFFRNQLRIAWKLPVLISEKGFSDAAGILDIKDKIRRNKRSEVGLIKFFYFSLVLYTLLKDPDVRQQNTFSYSDKSSFVQSFFSSTSFLLILLLIYCTITFYPRQTWNTEWDLKGSHRVYIIFKVLLYVKLQELFSSVE